MRRASNASAELAAYAASTPLPDADQKDLDVFARIAGTRRP